VTNAAAAFPSRARNAWLIAETLARQLPIPLIVISRSGDRDHRFR
jgi:hypothetical protein